MVNLGGNDGGLEAEEDLMGITPIKLGKNISGKSKASVKSPLTEDEELEHEDPAETNYNVAKNRNIGIEVEMLQSSAA